MGEALLAHAPRPPSGFSRDRCQGDCGLRGNALDDINAAFTEQKNLRWRRSLGAPIRICCLPAPGTTSSGPLNEGSPRMRNLSFVIAFALAQISLASAQDKSIVVASTTSTQDSGLFGHILPLFKAKTGIDVKVVALGTGQA